jgi:signal transduction histidine kinase
LKISIGNLGERLPVPNTGDELERLAEGWNVLLGKLDGAVEQLTQFTADVSHDLRTAITVMLTTSQLALKRRRSETEYREALATVERECQDTAQLLDDLLTLARAEVYLKRIVKVPVNIVELAIDSCNRVQALAEARSQQLMWTTQDKDIRIFGDAPLLQRLIAILLDNAIKYTPEQGSIHLCVAKSGNSVQLSVRDTGVGIPEHLSLKVFDRFVRGDKARQSQSGHGLGLSIAKWIVDAHEGQISLRSAVNNGTTFTIVFPAYC